jgi:hypothetical protein
MNTSLRAADHAGQQKYPRRESRGQPYAQQRSGHVPGHDQTLVGSNMPLRRADAGPHYVASDSRLRWELGRHRA